MNKFNKSLLLVFGGCRLLGALMLLTFVHEPLCQIAPFQLEVGGTAGLATMLHRLVQEVLLLMQPFQGSPVLVWQTQGSSRTRNPGLSDGIPLGFVKTFLILWRNPTRPLAGSFSPKAAKLDPPHVGSYKLSYLIPSVRAKGTL